MVFGVMASGGIPMDPHFIEVGLCLSIKEYIEIFKTVLPWIDYHWDRNDIAFIKTLLHRWGPEVLGQGVAVFRDG